MYKEFRFNYCIPRKYKDSKTGEIKYALLHGGEQMNVDTIENIQKLITADMPKAGCPWLQVFDNGYRVTNDNIDWSEWNGMTFSDVDSKWFYNYERQFDVDKLLKGLHNNAQTQFYDNFYAVYVTGSGKGYRIMWYWDCERTEDNFIKCALLTERYTRQLFYSLGEDAKKIIDYNYDGHRVLDSCSKSIKQGLYVTSNTILFSDYAKAESFGWCSLDDIDIQQITEISNVKPIIGNMSQSEHCSLIRINEPNKDDIRYYPHQLRRCIYEALIVLYNDKAKADAEWTRIAYLMPEQNGHTHEFYNDEPRRNKWHERFNANMVHELDWLKPFGYEYNNDMEYVYIDNFKKEWKKYIMKSVVVKYIINDIDREANEIYNKDKRKNYDKIKKDVTESLYKEFVSNNASFNIFDKCFDEVEGIETLRKDYWRTRWEPKDFAIIAGNYVIGKDIVSYKMYADFYYRDANNCPTVKYDILTDDIQLYSFWPETGKVQWHTFKYGNEYTHWKNHDTFTSDCNKSDIMEAVNKFIPRWFGYNSIKEYWRRLDLSIADVELLETWAVRHFNCPDTKLTRHICRTFFVASVKKQMIEDPTTFAYPHILCIQGPTGCGKSFFLKTMFTFDGHELILNKINPNDDDAKIGPLVAKNMLIQFGEGASLKKTDVQTQKEFVDRMNMGFHYQKKYENEQTTVYSRAMICRTSNEDTLFNDISIEEGDRRNLLLVCKTEANACDEKMRKQIMDEKDILWATAYKLYLDDPEQDLQLNKELFNELADIQEDFKMIKNSDIEEVYDDIFNRKYLTNAKGELLDYDAFEHQANVAFERFEGMGCRLGLDKASAELMNYDAYDIEGSIRRIPVSWIKSYVWHRYGGNYYMLLRKYMCKNGWEVKAAGYKSKVCKCFVLL